MLCNVKSVESPSARCSSIFRVRVGTPRERTLVQAVPSLSERRKSWAFLLLVSKSSRARRDTIRCRRPWKASRTSPTTRRRWSPSRVPSGTKMVSCFHFIYIFSSFRQDTGGRQAGETTWPEMLDVVSRGGGHFRGYPVCVLSLPASERPIFLSFVVASRCGFLSGRGLRRIHGDMLCTYYVVHRSQIVGVVFLL